MKTAKFPESFTASRVTAFYFFLAWVSALGFETIFSIFFSQSDLKNGVETILFFGNVSGYLAWMFLPLAGASHLILTRIGDASAGVERIRRHWRFIPHHFIIISGWIVGAAGYFLIKYFIRSFHDFHMIAFSLACFISLIFILLTILICFFHCAYEVKKHEKEQKSFLNCALDFSLNPYLLSCALIIILFYREYDWIRLVVNSGLVLEIGICIATPIALLKTGWLRKRASSTAATRILFSLLLILSLPPLLFSKYNQNIQVNLYKTNLLSAVIFKGFNQLLPKTESMVDPEEISDATSFDAQAYFSKMMQTPPEKSLMLKEIQEKARGMNILMITIDSLRADHVGCYGYSFPTTPVIDALARESVLFEMNFIQGGDSPHSLASLLSGDYPDESGKITQTMIQEILTKAGYETGYIGYRAVFEDLKFRENFSERRLLTEEYQKIWRMRTSEEITNQMIDLIKSFQGKQFFAYSHYLDPHAAHLENEFTHLFEGSINPPYDGEIAYTDHHLDRLFQFMKSSGIWDDSIVIISADHGDEFNEHGREWHGKNLYNESSRVPLIVKLPGIINRRVKIPTGSIDLIPTLLDLIGLSKMKRCEGTSLLPLIFENDVSGIKPVYSMIPNENYRKYAILLGNWKLIFNQVENTYELYDITEDYTEIHNLFDQRTGIANQLRRLLRYRFGLSDSTAKTSKTYFLNEPRDIDFNEDGSWAVVDFRNARILVFDRDDQLLTQFGKTGAGNLEFNDPSGIDFEDSSIFVADTFNHCVKKFDSAGKLDWVSQHPFFYPFDVAYADGYIWVSDIGSNQIVKLDEYGRMAATFNECEGSGGGFLRPAGISATPGGEVCFADTGNRRLVTLDSTGRCISEIPVNGWKEHPLNFPYVCFDDDHMLYASDPAENQIYIFNASNQKLISVLKRPASETDAGFSFPMGVDFDRRSQSLGVVDCRNNRIIHISKTEIAPVQ